MSEEIYCYQCRLEDQFSFLIWLRLKKPSLPLNKTNIWLDPIWNWYYCEKHANEINAKRKLFNQTMTSAHRLVTKL